jgi:hypothetical protein
VLVDESFDLAFVKVRVKIGWEESGLEVDEAGSGAELIR